MKKKQLINMTGIFFFVFYMVLSVSYGGVIFQDNFDSQDDWSPAQAYTSYECWNNCLTAPTGWDGYRVGKSEFIDSGQTNPFGNNTLNISSANARGGTGKAFTFWCEGALGGRLNFGSDGVLWVLFPEQEEVYVRFYIKFQPGWQWGTSNSPQQKFFRVSHYKGGSNVFGMKSSHGPMVIGDLAKYRTGQADIELRAAFRYENVYYPYQAIPPRVSSGDYYFGTGSYGGTGTDFWDDSTAYPPYGMMGDGNWHSWEFYVKINSVVGVADGIFKFWQDGRLIGEATDLAWGDEGSQENPRRLWNSMMIGGNNSNRFDHIDNKSEQWYAIDDVVISTAYIGTTFSAPTNLRIED